jgi:hypothetical protein
MTNGRDPSSAPPGVCSATKKNHAREKRNGKKKSTRLCISPVKHSPFSTPPTDFSTTRHEHSDPENKNKKTAFVQRLRPFSTHNKKRGKKQTNVPS